MEGYAAALRAGVERGLCVEALQKMLLEEHGVAVCGERLVCTWVDRVRAALCTCTWL